MDKIFDAIKAHPYVAAGGALVLLLLMKAGGKSSGGSNADVMLQSMSLASQTNIAMAEISAQTAAASNAAYYDYAKEVSLGAQAVAASNALNRTEQNIAALRTGENIVNTQAAFSLGAQQQKFGFEAALQSFGIQSKALDYDYMLGTLASRREDNALAGSLQLQNRALDFEGQVLASDERRYNTYVNQELPQVLRNSIDQIWHAGRAQRNIVKAGGMTSIWNNLISSGTSLLSKGMDNGGGVASILMGA